MDKPLVTIITATYNLIKNNRKDYFLQMIDSVKNQTYPNIEHLIIDGGSDDGSIELFKELNLNYISQKDEGIYDAYNKGINLAKGKYINFMNSDDFFCNKKAVEISVNALEKTNAVFSFATASVLKENGELFFVFKPQMYNAFVRVPFCHQTMFTRISVLKDMGGFESKYKSASDYDFVIKLVLKKVKYVQINDNFVSYRMGGESDVNMKNSCLERIKVFQDNYSKYIDINYNEAEKMLIAGHPSIKFLIKMGIVNPDMYFYVLWRYVQKAVKESLYFGLFKDSVISKFIKKHIIEPRIRVIKFKPSNLDEYVESIKSLTNSPKIK